MVPAAGVRREPRGQVFGSEILHELVAAAVVGEDRGHAHAAAEKLPGRDPAAAGIGLFRRIDDADDRAAVGESKAEVAAVSDVAGQRLDRDDVVRGGPRERFEAGGVGRDQKNVSSSSSPATAGPS
jgi:hypothetical protein